MFHTLSMKIMLKPETTQQLSHWFGGNLSLTLMVHVGGSHTTPGTIAALEPPAGMDGPELYHLPAASA